MKRIYACIAIVAVLLSVAFYSSWKVQSFADVISADLDTAAEAIRNADYPAARQALADGADRCDQMRTKMNHLLRTADFTWKWVPQRKPLVSCAAHRYRWKHWNGSRTGWYKQKHRPCPIGRKPVF